MSLGFFISNFILYKLKIILTNISAISRLKPSTFFISQSVFIYIENAILSDSSLYHFLPCVPIPSVCLSAIIIVPFSISFFSIFLYISFCVESIFSK